jgi:hypothetical protein
VLVARVRLFLVTVLVDLPVRHLCLGLFHPQVAGTDLVELLVEQVVLVVVVVAGPTPEVLATRHPLAPHKVIMVETTALERIQTEMARAVVAAQVL